MISYLKKFRDFREGKFKPELLKEHVSNSEFKKVLKKAEKYYGIKATVPNKTKKMCLDVGKQKINKIDYQGKFTDNRNVKDEIYQYYAYIQGWGHSKFKGSADWFLEGADEKSSGYDPILAYFYNNHHHKLMDYSYLKWNVTSDLQAAQIVANLRKGQKDVEPAYYLAKDYYNSFGESHNRNAVFDKVVTKVQAWMDKNKIETL